MATSSKKTTKTPAANITPPKKTVARKVVAATPASKATTSKAAATPAKKTTASAAKKTAATPAKKVSAPKAEKPAAAAKSAPKKSVRKNTVTLEERYQMIATAAYFRAEQRGFAGGYEMEDWTSGEAQIDAMLNA